ncbi:MAG TPA: hypothetical protein VKR06_23720 [Ktedonosporobacter sp.]|nr:hypothetical protein [Ktedonosporobacter sp.]
MKQSTFYQPISRDTAPPSRHCEWCGQPAVQQLTALGGLRHNQGGYFCLSCGKAFVRIVSDQAVYSAGALGNREVLPLASL